MSSSCLTLPASISFRYQRSSEFSKKKLHCSIFIHLMHLKSYCTLNDEIIKIVPCFRVVKASRRFCLRECMGSCFECVLYFDEPTPPALL